MSENALEKAGGANWKTKAILIGAILGAAVGVAAVYLLIQNSEDEGPPEISAGEGVKIGVLIFGLLRSIAGLIEGKKR